MPKTEPTRLDVICRAFLVLVLGTATGLLLPASVHAADAASEGEADYLRVCAECHAKGVNKNKLGKGAPRVGDRIAWESRIRKGLDALYRSLIDNPRHGKKGDPVWEDINPFMWRDDLSDAQIRAALTFMVDESKD